MPLEIVVCVKHTPSSTSVAVDPQTGSVKLEGLPHALNPFDEYALEEALRLKERIPGSKVTALTLGGAGAEQVLRDALALGCDEAAHLCDPAFDAFDSLSTAQALAAGVRKLALPRGKIHLVLCGKQTNDGESGHVGPALAAWLDWPSAISVRKISAVDESSVTVDRLMEDGADTLRLGLPAVVSVTKEINEPRLPSLKGKMAAKKAHIPRLSAAELGLAGLAAPTSVAKTSPVPSRPSGTLVPGGTPEEKARHLVEKLRELKFI